MDYRQGDVYLKKIAAVSGKKISEGRMVLAEGEVTGHNHVMRGQGVKFYESNGQVMVQVEKEAELVHQEHEKITVPAGAYAVVRQREYDLVNGVRQVMD